MNLTSYKRSGSGATTLRVLKHLGKQREPVTGKQVADGMGLPYGTVMCHLATIYDEGLINAVGESFELGMGMALFYSHRKARNETELARIEREMDLLIMNRLEV